ncbi:MAG: indole-3-glycerol phosphate synthase TrpC [Kordiimonadaceae bacterium]|nr:indole-3-glycerol phosphate synthase TrpC [Kordiimonadaceae bacterium]
MTDILSKIAATTREHVIKCKILRSLSDLEIAAKATSPVRGFHDHLLKAEKNGNFGLIAEIKKASPSKGLIREDFDPPALAKAYTAGGASCLSVLTDQPYFMGSDDYLVSARSETSLPVLRKDFMVDPYQIVEARVLGADCILLILAMIDDNLAAELEDAARHYNLDVLVEVHDTNELERGHKLKSPLLGINNRNLKTFEVSLDTTIELARLSDKNRTLVSESGLFTHDDLIMIREKCGINNFLIGESLMRQQDVEKATRKLLFNE